MAFLAAFFALGTLLSPSVPKQCAFSVLSARGGFVVTTWLGNALHCGLSTPTWWEAYLSLARVAIAAWAAFFAAIMVWMLGRRLCSRRFKNVPREGLVEPVDQIPTDGGFWTCPASLVSEVRSACLLQERSPTLLGRVRNIAAKWCEDRHMPNGARETYTLGALAAALVVTDEERRLAGMVTPGPRH